MFKRIASVQSIDFKCSQIIHKVLLAKRCLQLFLYCIEQRLWAKESTNTLNFANNDSFYFHQCVNKSTVIVYKSTGGRRCGGKLVNVLG